jgi:uncharacterized protein (DUF3084 family)
LRHSKNFLKNFSKKFCDLHIEKANQEREKARQETGKADQEIEKAKHEKLEVEKRAVELETAEFGKIAAERRTHCWLWRIFN